MKETEKKILFLNISRHKILIKIRKKNIYNHFEMMVFQESIFEWPKLSVELNIKHEMS